MSFYMKHFSNSQAVDEYEALIDDIREGRLDRFDYWHTLDMRESFEDGTRTLSAEERSRVDELDALLKKYLYKAMENYGRIEEYHNLGKPMPQKYWWWHLGETA